MSDVIATVAVVLGAALGVLSAVGILRMPDVYIRLQVASKASSLGVALLMLGVAVHFGELGVTVRALMVVVFLFLTAPVAAHVIGRAAYLTGVPLAAGTDPDELAGAYDRVSGRLMSPAERMAAETIGPDLALAAASVELSPDTADLIADMSGQEGDASMVADDGVPPRSADPEPPGS
jgi:multicomponent Na+:H+ antiporter subunit G